MHANSIAWNDLYTLLETYGKKPHPKPRPELLPASSTVSHGLSTDSPYPTVGVRKQLKSTKKHF
jgi:hypothetical protein